MQGLVNLNFLQEKKEADFRYGLVRIRENAESIAFYGGEENEMQLILQRFRSAVENLTVSILIAGYVYISKCCFMSSDYFNSNISFLISYYHLVRIKNTSTSMVLSELRVTRKYVLHWISMFSSYTTLDISSFGTLILIQDNLCQSSTSIL